MQIPTTGIVVDASCIKGRTDGYYYGITEWNGFDLGSKKTIFGSRAFPRANANIGEFLAIVDALHWLHQRGDTFTAVYSDSRTALSWFGKKGPKTTFPKDDHTRTIWTIMDGASDWLKGACPPNPVLFWDNRSWGENPADYGRK
jgi:ribonuclease HI